MTDQREDSPEARIAEIRERARIYRSLKRQWDSPLQDIEYLLGRLHEQEQSWRCFHCGEVFTTVGAASDHFGTNEGAKPGCLIDRVALEEGGKPERGRGLLMALRKAEAKVHEQAQEIEQTIQRVAELPDRTSPEDWPDVMLVTGDELRQILQDELSALLRRRSGETGGWQPTGWRWVCPKCRTVLSCADSTPNRIVETAKAHTRRHREREVIGMEDSGDLPTVPSSEEGNPQPTLTTPCVRCITNPASLCIGCATTYKEGDY